MFDFIKTSQPITDKLENYLLDTFEFKSLCKVKSPTCFYPKGFNDDKIDIKIFPNEVYYEFSLQKRSEGYKRGDNFTMNEMKHILSELENKYLINPKESKVINSEIGFSFPQLPALPFIQNIVACRSIPKTRDKHLGKGNSGKFKGASSESKFYDKGKQLKIPINIFRLEDKLLRSSIIRALGINNLSDLLQADAQTAALMRYQRTINSMVIIDEKILGEINPKELLFIKNCQIPPNWEKDGIFGNHTAQVRLSPDSE